MHEVPKAEAEDEGRDKDSTHEREDERSRDRREETEQRELACDYLDDKRAESERTKTRGRQMTEPGNEYAYRLGDDRIGTHGQTGPGLMGTARELDGNQAMDKGTATTHGPRSGKMWPRGKMQPRGTTEKREEQHYLQP